VKEKREKKGEDREKGKVGDDSVADDEEVKTRSKEERAKRREDKARREAKEEVNKVDADHADNVDTSPDEEPQKETKKRRWWEFNKKSE